MRLFEVPVSFHKCLNSLVLNWVYQVNCMSCFIVISSSPTVPLLSFFLSSQLPLARSLDATQLATLIPCLPGLAVPTSTAIVNDIGDKPAIKKLIKLNKFHRIITKKGHTTSLQ